MAGKETSVQSEYMFSRSFRDSARQTLSFGTRRRTSLKDQNYYIDYIFNIGFGKSV